MKIKYSSGHLLIEWLICLMLIITFSLFAISNHSNMNNRVYARQAIANMQRLLELSKAAAYHYQNTVTLCATEDGIHCNNAWHGKIMAFVDYGQTATFENHDILLQIQPTLTKGYWQFHGFKQPYVQFYYQGQIQANNGMLQYCPNNHQNQYSHGLIISHTGRIRISQDQDQDGIDEDSQGRSLQC